MTARDTILCAQKKTKLKCAQWPRNPNFWLVGILFMIAMHFIHSIFIIKFARDIASTYGTPW